MTKISVWRYNLPKTKNTFP